MSEALLHFGHIAPMYICTCLIERSAISKLQVSRDNAKDSMACIIYETVHEAVKQEDYFLLLLLTSDEGASVHYYP